MPNIQQQNMIDIAQDVSEKMKNSARESLNNSLELSYNSLVANVQISPSQLPEYIFVERFLPFFSGQLPVSDYPNLFIDWISIAGAPNREVAIIDDNNNELYRVPAIMSTESVGLANKNTLSEIFEEYELRSRQLPIVGQKYLATALAAKTKELINKNNNLATKEQAWLSIFSNYGIQPTETELATKLTYQVDEDLEYD
jgi:hypothetical protein